MNDTYEYVEDQSISIQHYVNNIFKWMVLGVAITFLTAFGLERTSFVYDSFNCDCFTIVCGSKNC